MHHQEQQLQQAAVAEYKFALKVLASIGPKMKELGYKTVNNEGKCGGSDSAGSSSYNDWKKAQLVAQRYMVEERDVFPAADQWIDSSRTFAICCRLCTTRFDHAAVDGERFFFSNFHRKGSCTESVTSMPTIFAVLNSRSFILGPIVVSTFRANLYSTTASSSSCCIPLEHLEAPRGEFVKQALQFNPPLAGSERAHQSTILSSQVSGRHFLHLAQQYSISPR